MFWTGAAPLAFDLPSLLANAPSKSGVDGILVQGVLGYVGESGSIRTGLVSPFESRGQYPHHGDRPDARQR
jgi:hypothetical protein